MINLSIGLAYVQHALKRKAENRQHIILQGMTFLFAYYDSRKLSPNIDERQEAHYNIARAYHMLGLNHLAIAYYTLVLEEHTHYSMEETPQEGLVIDAAYNLQTIYSTAGNLELASAITERWLVL
jgi:general transcription factor 3C polypeptide 3 (transcription factor C subunit 4)